MRKIILSAKIEVKIGETNDDYCSEGDLIPNLRTSLEDYIEWQESRYTAKFKILEILKQNYKKLKEKNKGVNDG